MPEAAVKIRLKVGGVVPFTTTDYPDHLSAVIFVQGCPWRCGYCHNPHLQPRTRHSPVAWETVMQLLTKRIGLLDGVVFSGGEPTMDPGLPSAIQSVRALGYKIGLHTGGTHPRRLAQVLPLVDWVGMDIKANFDRYARITQVDGSGNPAQASLHALLASGVAFECRTTTHPSLHSEQDLLDLAKTLATIGVSDYALQIFRPEGCANEALNNSGRRLSHWPSIETAQQIEQLFPRFQLRRDD